MTEYVVVKVTDAEGHLVEVGRTTAANDIAAIKAVAESDGPMMDGAYAVPARSWKLRKPERKVQETTLWT